jgi:hypothetical protein
MFESLNILTALVTEMALSSPEQVCASFLAFIAAINLVD